MIDNDRNAYGALINIPPFAKTLLALAEKAGCWETGVVSNRAHTRGEAINVDLYGHDEQQNLIVVQVRQCRFKQGRFPKIRKDYYLVGTTEQNEVFAHAVDSPARSRKAMETPQGVVSFVLAKIWGVKEDLLPHIERQGDVAFIPVYRIPDDAVAIEDGAVIRESHRVTGPVYRAPNGDLYAKRGAVLKHTKGEHARVKAREGTYRIVAGYRAAVWGFSRPTAD